MQTCDLCPAAPVHSVSHRRPRGLDLHLGEDSEMRSCEGRETPPGVVTGPWANARGHADDASRRDTACIGGAGGCRRSGPAGLRCVRSRWPHGLLRCASCYCRIGMPLSERLVHTHVGIRHVVAPCGACRGTFTIILLQYAIGSTAPIGPAYMDSTGRSTRLATSRNCRCLRRPIEKGTTEGIFPHTCPVHYMSCDTWLPWCIRS